MLSDADCYECYYTVQCCVRCAVLFEEATDTQRAQNRDRQQRDSSIARSKGSGGTGEPAGGSHCWMSLPDSTIYYTGICTV